MAKNNAINLTFAFERETKNTIRFTEQVEDTLDTTQIGTIYVSKHTLKAMGWREGNTLTMTLSIGK